MQFGIFRITPLRKLSALLMASALLFSLVLHSSAGISDEKNSVPPPTQLPGQPALLVGVAWYPEQWPESRWEEDLKLMEAAHIRAVRIAEFAWSAMEPTEGHFEFEWLDRAIALAAKHHIISIVGTPTAAPPAWLTFKYPETLRVEVKASACNTEAAHTDLPPRPSTANSAAALRSRWRSTMGTTRTSSAGRSTTNTATR